MSQESGAKGARSKAADKELSDLVGDLLRRVRSPEVLAGVAGAAAAARITKRAIEHYTNGEPDSASDADADAEDDDAQDETDYDPEDEAETDEEDDEPQADAEDETEDEADDEAEDEPRAEAEAEADDEPQADAEDETEDEEDDEAEDEPQAEAEDDSPDEDEAEIEDAADEGEEDEHEDESAEDVDSDDREETSNQSTATNGSLGSDDERMQLLARARQYAEELTGHSVESFSGLAEEDRGWRVGMEVVEVSRVPSTTDVLASYELILTGEGDLVDFRRAGRYYRNAADGTAA